MSVQLSRLRRAAAVGDRNLDVFKPTVTPFQRPKNSRYVEYHLKPQTLDDLRKRCQSHGDAAVRHACWRAVNTWMIYDDRSGAFKYSFERTNAVQLCARFEEYQSFPALALKNGPSALSLLSAKQQREARDIAAQAIVDWRDAGCLHLVKSIEDTYMFIIAFKRAYPHDQAEVTTN